MADRVHMNDESEGGFDSGDFGRRVRQFAVDAHRIVKGPDGPLDDLIDLHWRAWSLLLEAPGEQTDGVYHWLLAARRAIVDRLHHSATEEFETWVA
jgi:hypothetical protein